VTLVCFDLDGVLVDTEGLHATAFAKAMRDVGLPLRFGESARLAGLPTVRKLDFLGVPDDVRAQVTERKDGYAARALATLTRDEALVDLLARLHGLGWTLVCCTNNAHTARQTLDAIGVTSLFDEVYTAADHAPKPDPSMFLHAMEDHHATRTLAVEDSQPGLVAARQAGCRVLHVENRAGLTFEKVVKALPMWVADVQVVIPMAGRGQRFLDAGFTFPKPLIDVGGKPMVEVVVDCLSLDADYTFVVQAEHAERYALADTLQLVVPGSKMVRVDGVTEGAALTVLRAELDRDRPLMIVNSDQWFDIELGAFLYWMEHDPEIDGGLVTFTATHPKWSFVALGDDGCVTEVAEKRPISDEATAGIYYWSRAGDFIDSVADMVGANDRVNGEFYVAPVYNYGIKRGLEFRPYRLPDGCVKGLGTPEDLEAFLR